MADEDELEVLRERRLRRYERLRRDLERWLKPINIPLLICGFMAMLFMLPLGIILMTLWVGTHATIGALRVVPYVQTSSRQRILAMLTFALPIVVLFLELGDLVDLIAILALTVWVIVIAVHIHTLVLKVRRERGE